MYEPKAQDWLVFEAAGLRTRCMPDTCFTSHNTKIQEILLKSSEEQEQRICKKAYKNLNKEYGIKQLFGLGLVRLHALFNKKIQNPFRDGQHTFVCSEYVGDILLELGYNIKNLDELAPKDIYEVLNGKVV